MKRNRVFRRFAAVFLALFCMAATSTVAFAGGGDGEPYYTCLLYTSDAADE